MTMRTRSSCDLAARDRGTLFSTMQTLIVLMLAACVDISNSYIHTTAAEARLTQSNNSSSTSHIYYMNNGSSSTTSTILGLAVISKRVMVAELHHRIELHQPSSAFRITSSTAPDQETQITAADDVKLPDFHEHMNRRLAEYNQELDSGFVVRGGIVDVGLYGGFFRMSYFIQLGVGTRPVTSYLMFDTGSSLTWLQCERDSGGFSEMAHGAIYDRTDSSSFTAVSCPSAACSAAAPFSQGQCNDQGQCLFYAIDQYHSGAPAATGILGYEIFTFVDNVQIGNLPFGCVQASVGLENTLSGRGLLGVGGRLFSMPQRLQVGGSTIFFCLPVKLFDGLAPSLQQSGVAGFGDLQLPTENTIFTRLIRSPRYNNEYYMVRINGISIDGQLLTDLFDFDFTPTPDVGTMIDTGSFFSYLLPSAYVVVRDAFREAAQRKGLPRVTLHDTAAAPVDTCYLLDPSHGGPNQDNTPSMEFHFEDVDHGGISLPPANILYRLLPDHHIYCLTFSKNPHPYLPLTVLGNQQLSSFLVSINTQRMSVGFTPHMC